MRFNTYSHSLAARSQTESVTHIRSHATGMNNNLACIFRIIINCRAMNRQSAARHANQMLSPNDGTQLAIVYI